MIELRFILFIGAILVIWATMAQAAVGPDAFAAALLAFCAAFGVLHRASRDRGTRSVRRHRG
jgi:hypothetical protein